MRDDYEETYEGGIGVMFFGNIIVDDGEIDFKYYFECFLDNKFSSFFKVRLLYIYDYS